uniref:Zinc carboxypeptidase A 1 n=1 Tax=Nyssomyia neivai TaxID=330878 RepID=A0A1L8DPJ4_9DIPT
MKLLVLIFFGICSLSLIVTQRVRFDNYRVYSVSVESEVHLLTLRNLNKGLEGYDFLIEPRYVGSQADIIVPPHLQDHFETLAKEHELKVELQFADLQKIIDLERPHNNFQRAAEDFDVNAYHSTDEIYEWLYYLAEQYPEVQVIRGGSTYEGRDIIGININRNVDVNAGIFIESNIHAREWITSGSTVWMINKLLTATEDEPNYKDLADNINWYIFPVSNPDGYEYSRDVYRMWRKTRSRQGYICQGVDPNRNWDSSWQAGGVGASDNICDLDYAGPNAFSEIETRTMSEYILSIQDHLNIYISFHSAANLLLFPWGHTADPVSGYDDFYTVAQTTVNALEARYGTIYRFGSINQAIYPATGGSIDWTFLRMGILSYCYEFRSMNTATGERYGFLAPPEEIKPNSEEVLDSMVAMITKARELGHI